VSAHEDELYNPRKEREDKGAKIKNLNLRKKD
jgi:hypothetical protein